MTRINIFTNAYPYNYSESFFHSELLYIAEKYDLVKIFPKEKGILTYELPKNVEIIDVKSPELNNITKSIKKAPKLIVVFLFELIKSKHRFIYFKKYKIYLGKLVLHYNSLLPYINELNSAKDTTNYTYWLNDWSVELSLYKYIYNSNSKLISRVHGYDFDEIQINNNFHIFRHFVLYKYNKIVSISDYGKQYICNKYKAFKNKINVSYLGVNNINHKLLLNEEFFQIVSCSNVIELKRIDLIIEILEHIKLPINWVHIGTGVLLESLKVKAKNLPKNITVNWLGSVSNKEVLNFYANNPISLFINTSDYEGLPYSMIEAISYGIPICGRNVCGISEIVKQETGILLKKNIDAKETAYLISDFLIKKSSDFEFRNNIKLFSKINFSAEINYPQFIKKYLN